MPSASAHNSDVRGQVAVGLLALQATGRTTASPDAKLCRLVVMEGLPPSKTGAGAAEFFRYAAERGLAMTETKRVPIILQVDIVAPDSELAKSGDCYTTLRREIDLPFVPFIGLRLSIEPQVTGEQESRYSELFDLVESKTMFFDIEQIRYHIDRPGFVLYARNQFEPTLEQFHALQEYLVSYYGFQVF